MFRRLRETGPVALVPAAWGVVIATYIGAVTDHALFVAHVVMTVLLAGFAATGYADMREGLLRVWWRVIAVGVVPAAAGVVGFAADIDALLAVALYGWMGLPAVGLYYTGRRVPDGRVVYLAGTALCLVGAVAFATAPVIANGVAVGGLVAVGLGQTAGIADTVARF
ncbi:hypothetical protein [Natronomonas sp.]|uniref:hypothetical protein n=1 Tax=Natronomonas sp. TaxID=2184060 RepID=UPI002FC3CFFB